MKPAFISKRCFVVLFVVAAMHTSYGQNKTLGVGISSPNPNAALHIESPTTNQGLILPRLTTAQRTAMAGLPLTSADNGLIVYDKDEAKLYIWNGSSWQLPGLTLPYSNTTSVPGHSFHITNDATSGAAGIFNITDSANSGTALRGYTLGKGLAGDFQVVEPSSSSNALLVVNSGFGSAARIAINNVNNSSPAIEIDHPGTGNAITANRPIQATQFIGDGSTLTNLPKTAWGLSGSAGTVDSTHFIGTTDDVPLNFKINNEKAGRIDKALNNAFFGYRAGNAINSGRNNTGIGSTALTNNTTGLSNTAIGVATLLNNVAGSSNVALGTNALSSNKAGSNGIAIGINAMMFINDSLTPFTNTNVAVGFEALKGAIATPSTGLNNTAVGYQAQSNILSGNNNTAVGSYALTNNTTAANNTATGHYALAVNTTGGSNSAFGKEAMAANTIGVANSSVGESSLFSNNDGSNNVAVGRAALFMNTSGNSNTALGYAALETNTTGTNNTAIGGNANVTSGILTNATAIGYNALVNASNKVRIGNTAITVIEGQVAFTAASDRRLKKDIRDLDEGTEFIMKLRPVTYLMRDQNDHRRNWGFIAQEIEALVGKENSILTIGGDSLRTLGLRYTDFIAPLVKTAQEQQEVITLLEQRVRQLSEVNTKQQSALQQIRIEETLWKNEYNKRLDKLEELLGTEAEK